MVGGMKTRLRSPPPTKKFPPFQTNKISCLSQNPNILNMNSQPNSKRPTCTSCSKPISLCLCTRLKNPNLDNQIHVTILQHSLEKKHPLNSAKIAKLGLKNVLVFNVTDVNYEAHFEIWPLGFVDEECTPTVCGNASQSLVFDGSVESKVSRKRDFGRICELDLVTGSVLSSNSELILDGHCERIDEIAGSEGVAVFSCKDDVRLLNVMSKDLDSRNDEPLMSVTIGKSGKISCVSHKWKLLDESIPPKIEHIIDSTEAMEYLARGFMVKKLQKKESGSMELDRFEEFEIRVPPGSALLFPAENAVAIEAINFQVKNLIVLDGTWSKAKRMYLENPWLRILPSVRLDVEKTSLFSEVRRQPKPGYLSTIESIVYALEGLGQTENLSGLDNLLDVFESMVADQRRYKDESMTKLSST